MNPTSQPAAPDEANTLGYVRVSSREQASDWKGSLRQQRDAISALARKLDRELSDGCIFEDRFSGEDAVNRPGFMALVAHCNAHPRPAAAPGFVLFLNDSRFGRFDDPDEAAYWRFELARTGWLSRFAENDDTDHTTTRSLLRSLGAAQASEYLVQLKHNARRGAENAVEKGLWQGRAPFGYRRVALAPGREPTVLDNGERKAPDQVVRLIAGPDAEVATLRWLFETYAAGGASLGGLVGPVRARAPRLKWSMQNLAKVLSNRTYLGEVIWFRRPAGKRGGARRVKVRPRSQWKVREGAHPALIDAELFARVQARLAGNKRARRGVSSGYALSGMIRCAACGAKYIGGGGPRNEQNPADPDRYRFYRESGSWYDGPPCGTRAGTLTKRIVESMVVAEVARLVSAPGVQDMIRSEIDRRLAETRALGDAPLRAARKEKATTEDERRRLADAIARGILGDAEAAEKMDEIRARLARADAEIARIQQGRDLAGSFAAERERLVALAVDFPARAAAASGSALRALLEPWVDSAAFDKDTRELTLVLRRIPASAPTGADLIHTRTRMPSVGRDSSGRWRTVVGEVQ